MTPSRITSSSITTLIAAYLGLFVGLTAGSLGDRFGRRALLRFGLTTFVVASLACAAAPSLPPPRPLIRYCVDWTEQRHHLSGALGRAILDRFVDTDWVKRMPRGRAVKVTPEGRTALADWFGVDWTD